MIEYSDYRLRLYLTDVVARVELLPLASLRDFVRGRMGESTRQVEGLFESLLAQSFDDPQRE
jgi:hypothetical protein